MEVWRLGEGKTGIEPVGITTGNADNYQLGCWMSGADIPPVDLMAGVMAMPGIVGEPASHKATDSNAVAFERKVPADSPRAVLTLYYDPARGRQPVSLNFDQFVRAAAPM